MNFYVAKTCNFDPHQWSVMVIKKSSSFFCFPHYWCFCCSDKIERLMSNRYYASVNSWKLSKRLTKDLSIEIMRERVMAINFNFFLSSLMSIFLNQKTNLHWKYFPFSSSVWVMYGKWGKKKILLSSHTKSFYFIIRNPTVNEFVIQYP